MIKIEQGKIYPNLNRPNKWLGIIEYRVVVIVLIYMVVLWLILGIFIDNNMTKLYMELIMVVPVLVVFYTYINEDDAIYVIYIIIRFILSTKIYVYVVE